MTFAYPWVLLFLTVPIVAGIWAWKRSGQRVALPLDGAVSGRGTGWRVLLNVFGAMPALLLSWCRIMRHTQTAHLVRRRSCTPRPKLHRPLQTDPGTVYICSLAGTRHYQHPRSYTMCYDSSWQQL